MPRPFGRGFFASATEAAALSTDLKRVYVCGIALLAPLNHRLDSMMRCLPALLATPIVAGCIATPVPDDTTTMANPASVYCESVGGEVEIQSEADGEVGYCRLPDGRVFEEWALYRANNP